MRQLPLANCDNPSSNRLSLHHSFQTPFQLCLCTLGLQSRAASAGCLLNVAAAAGTELVAAAGGSSRAASAVGTNGAGAWFRKG